MSEKPTDHQTFTFPRGIECVLQATRLTPSGKYEFFVGEHFHRGKKCFDVGVLNCVTGQVTRRHYRSHAEDEINKAESLAYWQEVNEKLDKIQEPPEETEGEKLVTLN
jgi:hypothetical protein